MGIHVIKMPDIGEGIAEVEVVVWRVQPGETIKEDQILADVMTDKATIEIPSPVAGIVMALGGKAGELMAVGAEMIRIEVEGKGNVRDAAGFHYSGCAAGGSGSHSGSKTEVGACCEACIAACSHSARQTGCVRHANPCCRRRPIASPAYADAPGTLALNYNSCRAAVPAVASCRGSGQFRARRQSHHRQGAISSARTKRSTSDRTAPQDRAKDAGIQTPHPAFHLCRRNRHDRTGSPAH